MLGSLFAVMIWLPYVRHRGEVVTLVSAIVVLTSVWVVNFFVILPVINPSFVTLMPYWASLFSKLLFGITMAGVLNGFPHTDRPRVTAFGWIA